MSGKQWFSLLKQSVSGWMEDDAPSKGAAIAYYALFSIAPLLFIMITVAGMFFGVDAVRGAIFEQLSSLMGQPGAEAVQEMLAHVSEPKTGVWATVLGAVVLIFGATTVFAQLQSALDAIWEVPEEPEAEKNNAIWTFVKTRLLSFGLVLGLAFLIIVSLLLSAALSALGKWWGPWFGQWEALAHVFDLAVSYGVLVVAFAAIYKFMPRAHIQWRDVWVGSAVTALLFTAGKFLIGLYLGKSGIGSSFGAFGSIVIVMVWVYYSAQIFLLGAEFTWVYAHQSGSRRGQATQTAPATPRELPALRPAPVIRVVTVPQPGIAATLRKHAFKFAVAGAFLSGAALRRVIR
jgi:membrane protein